MSAPVNYEPNALTPAEREAMLQRICKAADDYKADWITSLRFVVIVGDVLGMPPPTVGRA